MVTTPTVWKSREQAQPRPGRARSPTPRSSISAWGATSPSGRRPRAGRSPSTGSTLGATWSVRSSMPRATPLGTGELSTSDYATQRRRAGRRLAPRVGGGLPPSTRNTTTTVLGIGRSTSMLGVSGVFAASISDPHGQRHAGQSVDRDERGWRRLSDHLRAIEQCRRYRHRRRSRLFNAQRRVDAESPMLRRTRRTIRPTPRSRRCRTATSSSSIEDEYQRQHVTDIDVKLEIVSPAGSTRQLRYGTAGRRQRLRGRSACAALAGGGFVVVWRERRRRRHRGSRHPGDRLRQRRRSR